MRIDGINYIKMITEVIEKRFEDPTTNRYYSFTYDKHYYIGSPYYFIEMSGETDIYLKSNDVNNGIVNIFYNYIGNSEEVLYLGHEYTTSLKVQRDCLKFKDKNDKLHYIDFKLVKKFVSEKNLKHLTFWVIPKSNIIVCTDHHCVNLFIMEVKINDN